MSVDYTRLERGIMFRLGVIEIPACWRREFALLVSKWVRCSGVEWTVKRLKSLKVDFYRQKAKLPFLTPWIHKNSSGEFSGVIGSLFRWGSKSDRNFRKIVQCLMVYSWFYHESPTDTQMKKFISAVTAKAPVMEQTELEAMRKAFSANFRLRTVDRSMEVDLLLYRGSSSKRRPYLGLLTNQIAGSLPQDAPSAGEVSWLLASEPILKLYYGYRELFDPVLKSINLNVPWGRLSLPTNQAPRDPRRVVAGRVAYIQEAGLKLRAVASPLLLFQLVLRHFGAAAYRVAKELPWDCTHDQSKPVSVLQRHLLAGRTVHSVDLSNATDYFPLEFQSLCMRALFGNISDISLFEELSRARWKTPSGEFLSWERGQPLGLYPSFGVFTVSHGMLLWYLNGCRWNDESPEFYVLGDDVVITDPSLYEKYIQTLERWGCPWSPDKTLSSNQICEFAGKVITSDSVTSQYKWREMSDENFIDICRQLGIRSRALLTARQRKVFDKIAHCASPLGLGFSYSGSTLLDLMENTAAVFGQRERPVLGTLVDQRPVINRNLYGSEDGQVTDSPMASVNLTEVEAVVRAFDKKASSVFQQILGSIFTRNSGADLRHYVGVPSALGNTDLPMLAPPVSWESTLDRYERLLAE